jgi:DNA-binding GntR family transcriptional regulator
MPVPEVTEKEREINRVMNALTNAIAQQRIAPGTRLIEAQLVDIFKANRNHIRVALQRLSLKKIITIQPNRGATISEPTIEEARDVFNARSVVERGIIDLLMQRITASDIKRLKNQIKQEEIAQKRNVREEIITASGDFHILLAELSGSAVLTEVLNNLITRSSLILALYQRRDLSHCGCDEHRSLVKTLEVGDAKSAIENMEHHLRHIEADLNLDFWRNKKVNLSDVLNDLDN